MQAVLHRTRWARYVFEPLDVKVIPIVDGGEVFGKLGESQRICCHEH